eukprot:406923_1
MLSNHQQELLCDGYIRNNYTHDTPTPIKRMIHQFWNEYFWWIFKEAKLNKFLNAYVGECIQGEEFQIGDISCFPLIFPNDNEFKEQVMYGLDFYLSSDVESVVVYYELYCIQTKMFYKDSTMLCKNDTDNNMLLWSEPMQLSQCHNYNELDFMYYVDILRIEYNSNCIKENYCKDIKISNRSEYKWNISSKQLNEWNNNNNFEGICGPSFDNNCWVVFWYLLPDPNGAHLNSSKIFCPGLTLLQIPRNIEEINFKIILNIEPNIYHYETMHSFNNEALDLAVDTELTFNDIIMKANNSSIYIQYKIQIME